MSYLNGKELEQVFRHWCLSRGLLEAPGRQPTTFEEAERDIRILEWLLDGKTPPPKVAARLDELRALMQGSPAVR